MLSMIILHMSLCCTACLQSVEFEWTVTEEKEAASKNSREGNYPSNLSTCFFPLTGELKVLMRIIS